MRAHYYLSPVLLAGHEYEFFQLPKIDKHSYSDALALAEVAASVNTHELLLLGYKLQSLADVNGFKNVWNDYLNLITRLYKQTITNQFVQENVRKKAKVPALGFHSHWKVLTGSTGLRPPVSWQIQLTQ